MDFFDAISSVKKFSLLNDRTLGSKKEKEASYPLVLTSS
jgi:hypothetical protein